MRIAEIYKSIQGEGFLAGTESVFVRASGCNLRCWYCDTPFASWNPDGDDWSVEEILEEVELLGAAHVVVTGGEPMLFSELIPLCDGLRRREKHITIETAGTLFLTLACDLMSISPKFSSSAPSAASHPQWHQRHQRTRMAPDVLRRLVTSYPYQVKFVIDRPSDLDEFHQVMEAHPEIDPSRVMLMPQGIDLDQLVSVEAWLRPYCQQHSIAYCPRLQIEWFGFVRGT